MRVSLMSLLLLATVACGRSPAPTPPGGSALPPPPTASIAQSVPAGSTPEPATTASVQRPVAAVLRPEPGAKPAVTRAAGKPPPSPRWVDVDPNNLPVGEEPALAEFQAEQRRRDAELLQRDADEAAAVRAGRAPDRQREDARYREPPRQRDAYADDRYADDRYADDRHADDRYQDRRYQDLPPYDEGEHESEEPPYYEGDEYYEPGFEEPYDQRDDGYYRLR